MSAIEFPSDRLMNTTLEIAKRRKDTLVLLKRAIRARDLDEADRLITELVPDEKSNRVSRKRASKFGG